MLSLFAFCPCIYRFLKLFAKVSIITEISRVQVNPKPSLFPLRRHAPLVTTHRMDPSSETMELRGNKKMRLLRGEWHLKSLCSQNHLRGPHQIVIKSMKHKNQTG